MTKFITLFVAAMLLSFSSVAHTASTDPSWEKVKPGETPQMFAQRNLLSVTELIELNPDLARRPNRLIPYEPLNVNPATPLGARPLHRWVFAGGDPAGPSLEALYAQQGAVAVAEALRPRQRAQIAMMSNIPDTVRVWFDSMVQHTVGRVDSVTSSPDDPLVMMGLGFGGYVKGSKEQYWSGTTIAMWTDRNGQPISQQLAMVYPEVVCDGVGYTLMTFLHCQNSAPVPRLFEPPAPIVETPSPPAPPETTVVDTTPAPPPPSPTPAPKLTGNRYYPENCAYWLTWEDVTIDPNGQSFGDRHQDNFYAGHEHTYWADVWKTYGLRYRLAPSFFDSETWSFDANLGAVYAPKFGRTILDLEGGGYYKTQQRLTFQPERINEDSYVWRKHKTAIDEFGPYARVQLVHPDYHLEGKATLGSRYVTRLAQLTVRPGSWYGKISVQQDLRGYVRTDVDGRQLGFPADSMTMREARLGYDLTPWFTLYAAYDDWQYRSKLYDFDRRGPGLGCEWYFRQVKKWRFDAKVSRFTAEDRALWYETHQDVTQLTLHETHDKIWRAVASIVYAPSTRWIGLKHPK